MAFLETESSQILFSNKYVRRHYQKMKHEKKTKKTITTTTKDKLKIKKNVVECDDNLCFDDDYSNF